MVFSLICISLISFVGILWFSAYLLCICFVPIALKGFFFLRFYLFIFRERERREKERERNMGM